MLDLTINRQSLDSVVKQVAMDANCIKFVEVLFANYYAVIERELITNHEVQCVVAQWTKHNHPELVGYLSELWLEEITTRLNDYLAKRIKGRFAVNIKRNKGAKDYIYTVTFVILPDTPDGKDIHNCVAVLERRPSNGDLNIQARLWSGQLEKGGLVYVIEPKTHWVELMQIQHMHRHKQTLTEFDQLNENVYLRLSYLNGKETRDDYTTNAQHVDA